MSKSPPNEIFISDNAASSIHSTTEETAFSQSNLQNFSGKELIKPKTGQITKSKKNP